MSQTMSPRETDEKLADLYGQEARIQSRIDSLSEQLYRMAGHKPVKEFGQRPYWKRTTAELLEDVKMLVTVHGDKYDPRYGMTPGDGLSRLAQLRTEQAQVTIQIRELEAIYDAAPWSRFFPCGNRDGHIHSSLRGCSSVRWDTLMAWYPSLSGKTVEEAVAELGPALCQICFPAAKAEHKRMTLGQVADERTRPEREAAKAERDRIKAAKRLADNEVFRIDRGRFGERIETVAAAKDVLRRERELFWYYGRGPHCDHAAWAAGAEQATKILLAREARHAGTGATLEEIERIIATADKKHAKLAKESQS
jgi:hypothetical protein